MQLNNEYSKITLKREKTCQAFGLKSYRIRRGGSFLTG
jgi:hypothetical protein